MKKLTAQGRLEIISEETEIKLSAGNHRMIMEISHNGKKLPVRTFRRALAYREFLSLFDMPVYVYVNSAKIIKLNGNKFWVYRPFKVAGWFIRDLFSV